MKNTILWGALFTLIGAQVHADLSQPVALPAPAPSAPNTAASTAPQVPGQTSPSVTPATPQAPVQTSPSTTPATPLTPVKTSPSTTPATPQAPGQTSPSKPLTTPQPPNQTSPSADSAIPTPPSSTAPAATPPQPAAPVINCEYKIPAETKTIDQSLIKTWAEKAVTQTFDLNASKLDEQLQKLQPCFTEQGWTGFNTALKKSGNLEAIKAQKLNVSSQIEGQVVVIEAKDNEWKLNLPLQVVYQNENEKVTQLLSVDLTVSRKITGDLGITQMIAAPREPAKVISTEKKPEETKPEPHPGQTSPIKITPSQTIDR